VQIEANMKQMLAKGVFYSDFFIWNDQPKVLTKHAFFWKNPNILHCRQRRHKGSSPF